MRDLPTGTVTLLFTDIEGSTKLLHELGDAYADALAEHRRMLREAFANHGGVEVDTQGDAFFVAFERAKEALAAATDAQQALGDGPVRARMGLHTGEPIVTDEGYVGVDVHRAARIMAAGHGGQILLSQTTRDLLLDSSADLRELGEHRLKDLSAPQRLYQVGGADFPPLETLQRTNLPVQPTPFVGRERELAAARRLLESTRLLTLVGPGGTGKTRLALQLAADVADEFVDGVFFVSLASITDPQLVEPTVAQAVGSANGLDDHLRHRNLLLLLDNLEHVSSAATRFAELLAAAPRVKLIATSREPLHVAAERECAVAPLEENEAVALFRDRAGLAESGEAVAEICRRLDGLPLAIELAAARANLLPPDALLERLELRLPLLTAGPRDAPDRQRTLRATIEWSYDLLEEELKVLFGRLAVFVGSFTLEAAEQVCESDLDAVASLVDKSLLRQREGRLEMLETIHEYAVEVFTASGEANALRRRHFDFFLACAERAEADLLLDRRESFWFPQLEADHDNYRAALQWARDAGEGALELRLVAALAPFWIRIHFHEGRNRILDALATAPDADAKLRANALRPAVLMSVKQGDLEQGRRLGEEAAAIDRAEGDDGSLARSLTALGVVESLTEPEKARGLFEESRSLFEQLGDERGLATVAHDLGLIALNLGDDEEARTQLATGLALARKNGAQGHVANALCDLGFVALHQNDLEQAAGLFAESVRHCVELDWKEDAAYCLVGLAALGIRSDELELAARLVGAAETLASDLHLNFEPYAAEVRQQTIDQLKERLGEEQFTEPYRRGRSMSFEDAVSLATADID